ncbi:MAG: hypothetical protein KAI66_11765 [Lentisphaeria bacterium]|nr:hypothetical protein [Lentisphaeria bacterium]
MSQPDTKKTGTDRLENAGASSVFPVALLSNRLRCLVVGGGTVASRKTRILLDAGAPVRVVAPELCPDLAALVESGRIEHEARTFEETDVQNASLVFAATDDKALNARVLELCRGTPALACAVDQNWRESAFITPATIRHDNLCVSITTGGKTCRTSRLLKNSIGQHLHDIHSAELVVVGTSHNYLTVEEREPYHLVGQRLSRVGTMLKHVRGLHEFILLATCNRVEMIGVATAQVVESGILQALMELDELHPDRYYIKLGQEAFRHTALVTAGLLSQTPGEKHIVAQVKDALRECEQQCWSGSMITQWISSSLHISKDIRREFAGMLESVEIEALCLRYLQAQPGTMANRHLLVVGTGAIGEGLVRGLRQAGTTPVWCYHRNRPEPSSETADEHHIVSLNDLRTELPKADTILCATGAGAYVLHSAFAPFLNPESETLIIDLAVPRNVDPQLERLVADLRIVNLDDLKHWLRREQNTFDTIMQRASDIIREHKADYDKLVDSFQNRDAVQ